MTRSRGQSNPSDSRTNSRNTPLFFFPFHVVHRRLPSFRCTGHRLTSACIGTRSSSCDGNFPSGHADLSARNGTGSHERGRVAWSKIVLWMPLLENTISTYDVLEMYRSCLQTRISDPAAVCPGCVWIPHRLFWLRVMFTCTRASFSLPTVICLRSIRQRKCFISVYATSVGVSLRLNTCCP